MWHNFFQHIDILPENVHILDGDGKTSTELEVRDAGQES